MAQDKEDITALVQTYIEAFNRADFEACLQCYRLPFSFITGRGVSVLQHDEEFLTMWRQTHEQLCAAGYSHSVLREVHVRLLDENLALASVLVARYGTDGAEMEISSGLYTLRKGREGWKLLTVVTQRAEEMLRFGA